MNDPGRAPEAPTAATEPTTTAGAPPSAGAPTGVPAGTPPASGARGLAERHPMLLAWIALSIGMVAILLYTSRDVGLQPSQTLAMVAATIALAGACVWIITWD